MFLDAIADQKEFIMNQKFFNLCLAGFTLISAVAFAQEAPPANANPQQGMQNPPQGMQPNASQGMQSPQLGMTQNGPQGPNPQQGMQPRGPQGPQGQDPQLGMSSAPNAPSAMNSQNKFPVAGSRHVELSDNTETSGNQPMAIIDSGGSLQAAPAGGAQTPSVNSSSAPASASLGTELPQAPNSNQPMQQQPMPAPTPSAPDSTMMPQSNQYPEAGNYPPSGN